MRWAFYQPSSGWRHKSLSHRAVALILAIVIEALLLLALLQIGPVFTKKPVEPALMTTFEMLPATVARTVTKVEKSGGAPPAKAPTPRTAPVVAPVVPKSQMVILSSKDFAASDISKLARQGGNGESGTGKGSGSAMGPGEGPGGEPMYNAEWYVKPPRGALALYLPNGAPPNSWGMVACKTIPNYGVENCQQLGESPVGSGIARALRQAAWQFKVRPPRIGGRALMGVWVRIRFDFTQEPKDSEDRAGSEGGG
ncbi:hypothetical protein [Sphingomonas sp.]|uniref:hypothetical protein n=1 Tax=Sphingomonas sp. TaxID=28214 RepID=UPI0025E83BFE|nr:hypothetical protein [Sphingomonas sp.]